MIVIVPGGIQRDEPRRVRELLGDLELLNDGIERVLVLALFSDDLESDFGLGDIVLDEVDLPSGAFAQKTQNFHVCCVHDPRTT